MASQLAERTERMQGRIVAVLTDVRTGKKQVIRQRNVITNVHRNLVAQWMAGLAPNIIDYIALGTGAETQYAHTNRDATIDLTSSGADQRLSQGFQLTNARTVNSALLYLQRVGTSVGNVYLEICQNSAGQPGTVIATSDVVAINSLATSYAWQRFVFSTPPSLSAATQYHLVLRSASYTYSNGVTEVNLGVDQSAPGYTNGAVSTYNGTTWSTFGTASDACFRIVAQPDATYTTIVDETTRQQMTSKTVQSSYIARLLAAYTTTQANGRHGMIGMFNASSGGVLSAAANIDIEKTNTQTLNIYWLITVN